jgi:leucyl aminopeptidase
MQISFISPGAATAGALAVGAWEGGHLAPAAEAVDKAMGGALKRAVQIAQFKGKPEQVLELMAPVGVKASRVLLLGLGNGEDFDANVAERIAAAAVARLLTSGETKLTFSIDRPKGAKVTEAALGAHLAMGARLRSYRFDHYRTVSMKGDMPTLTAVAIATKAAAKTRSAWADLEAVTDGMFLARDLVNEPSNILHPEEFARRASALSKLGVKVQVLGVAEMKKLGMNALLGVGQGSAFESRLVIMHWDGTKTAAKTKTKKAAADAPVAFVGKGVCFDSGGLSLKPAGSMMGMKGDMGGAAAVTGLMYALAKRKAKVNAIGVIGLVENMPDGKAQRPNDIVKSMSGQTIEVLNTDAEGRLVLADALWYTQSRFKPRFMIDLATLTGAILVSLGAEYAGLFSNNDTLSERLTQAGQEEGEPIWRLPLGPAYDKLIRSKIADVKNIGGPNAGSITAARFLQRFVNDVPWAHLDIAGVAWQDGEQKPLVPSWGVGWGVRILNRLIADHYES